MLGESWLGVGLPILDRDAGTCVQGGWRWVVWPFIYLLDLDTRCAPLAWAGCHLLVSLFAPRKLEPSVARGRAPATRPMASGVEMIPKLARWRHRFPGWW